VGAEEIQDRPILRSGEVLETVPGLIITHTRRRRQGQPIFSSRLQSRPRHGYRHFPRTICRLTCRRTAHGEGYSDMNTVIPEFVKRWISRRSLLTRMSATLARLQMPMWNLQDAARELLQGGRRHAYLWRAVFGASQKARFGRNCSTAEKEFYYDGPWCIGCFNKITANLTNSQQGR